MNKRECPRLTTTTCSKIPHWYANLNRAKLTACRSTAGDFVSHLFSLKHWWRKEYSTPGLPRHRENGELGSSLFQTMKPRGICLKILKTYFYTGNLHWVPLITSTVTTSTRLQRAISFAPNSLH